MKHRIFRKIIAGNLILWLLTAFALMPGYHMSRQFAHTLALLGQDSLCGQHLVSIPSQPPVPDSDYQDHQGHDCPLCLGHALSLAMASFIAPVLLRSGEIAFDPSFIVVRIIPLHQSRAPPVA
ncbi:MAG: hypothetical protein HQM11_08985 [SAR324 cluster bacterium]|nr:hypothetical protein [SAR324 cluster bacterium]